MASGKTSFTFDRFTENCKLVGNPIRLGLLAPSLVLKPFPRVVNSENHKQLHFPLQFKIKLRIIKQQPRIAAGTVHYLQSILKCQGNSPGISGHLKDTRLINILDCLLFLC